MNLFEKIRFSSGLNSLLLVAAGVLLIRNPVGATKMILMLTGCTMLLSGITDVIRYFSARGYSFMGGSMIMGVVKVIMGIYMCSHTYSLIHFFSYVLGFFVLVCGINSMENALRLKYEEVPGWLFSIVMAVLVVFASVMMMFRPFAAVSTAVKLAGVVLVVTGAADLYALYRMREIF